MLPTSAAVFFLHADREYRPHPVDEAVRDRRDDDLASQLVLLYVPREAALDRLREVARELAAEERVVRDVRVAEPLRQPDLGIGQEHRELGPCQAEPFAAALGDFIGGRQRLDGAIQRTGALERVDDVAEFGDALGGTRLQGRDSEALKVVVAEHEARDLVGHAREQRIALGAREPARCHQRVEQDLEVDLDVRRVDARGVVDEIGVDAPARLGILDAPALRESKVAALADDAAAQFRAIDAHRVIGAVADLGIRFLGRLDVGSDAAVPEQVHGQFQDCPDHFDGDASRLQCRAVRAPQRRA
jgi:hypothetical protein